MTELDGWGRDPGPGTDDGWGLNLQTTYPKPQSELTVPTAPERSQTEPPSSTS